MKPEHELRPDEAGLDELESRMTRQPWRPVPPAWRSEILTPVKSAPARSSLWREFLWPTPWAWGALAAVWILVVGFSSAAEQTARRGVSLARRDSTPPPLLGWREQQALISALLDETPPPERQPASPPRPRSDLRGPRFGRQDSPASAPSLV